MTRNQIIAAVFQAHARDANQVCETLAERDLKKRTIRNELKFMQCEREYFARRAREVMGVE